MSENEEIPETSETQLLTAEYKDGQLQIVEMNPFDKVEGVNDMPSLEGDNVPKYVQVINPDKSVMQLDLLNLTLVRCEDGSESYRLVSASEIGDSSSEATVTCVLHSSDNEAEVMLADAEADADAGAYVVMDGRPLVLYEQEPPEPEPAPEPAPQPVQAPVPPRKLTPNEILERAKALQKAKAQLASLTPKRRGRGRRSELPPPHELLASPGFKLFLYSCRMCSFKCNAVKEMTKHKVRLTAVFPKKSTFVPSEGTRWRCT
ncbi:uncharacterized protein LOC135084902 [Ostrinia nubilalis]|uniref:uncharacterized protein LOC135084902 n=1 Tax=Ostrinia nubilalis TaxID=29057 RepID=UPI0030826765